MSEFYQKVRWLELKAKILDAPAYSREIHDELLGREFNHVLDCGTGTGLFVKKMQEVIKFNSLKAIEINEELVEEARKNFADSTNVEFIRQNFYDLPNEKIPEKKFDLIMGQAFLEHTNIERALPIIKSLSQPDGYLYFPHNYMSPTIFDPHLSMDKFIVNNFDSFSIENQNYGRKIENQKDEEIICGDSRNGAKLYTIFSEYGFEIIKYVNTGWLLYPKQGTYSEEEKEILGMLVNFFYEANKIKKIPLSQRIDDGDLDEWKITRERQIDENKLVFICHQGSILLKNNN